MSFDGSKAHYLVYSLFILLFVTIFYSQGRSVHRTPDPSVPCIYVRWKNDRKKYFHQDSHYEPYPIFTSFDKKNFYQNLLPADILTHDYKQKIKGKILDRFLNILIQEIEQGKKNFSYFNVIQDKNFNYKLRCGLLVLKFKHYPFVVKLFMEQPATFLDPHCKGFEPTFFFYMAGGANRHMAGFTRIKNKMYIHKKLQKIPFWKGKVFFPRKWFWLPKNIRWLQIKGKNIGGKKCMTTTIPSTYAIIADYIDCSQDNLPYQQRCNIIMQLCNDLNMFIDPHMSNFVITYPPPSFNLKVTIIDTEHFPTMVGFKKKQHFAGHIKWIQQLATKCLNDIYFRPKSRRRAAQIEPNYLALTI